MPAAALEQRLLQALDAAQADVVEPLASLVRFGTDNPPGNNEAPAERPG